MLRLVRKTIIRNNHRNSHAFGVLPSPRYLSYLRYLQLVVSAHMIPHVCSKIVPAVAVMVEVIVVVAMVRTGRKVEVVVA